MNLRKSSPAILTALGVVGMIGTVIFAVKDTPKCEDLIEKAEARLREESHDDKAKISKKEFAKCFVKAYWPTLAMGAVSVACFVASNHISGKREAVAAAAFGAAEKSLEYFQDATLETVDDKVMDEIRAKVADRHLKEHPIKTDDPAVTDVPSNKTLCFDCYSGRYFQSDMQTIREVVNNFNETMLGGDLVTLNDLYFNLGLPEVKMGDQLGWHAYDGGDQIRVRFSSRIAENGSPCLVVDYDVEPAYFDKNFI